MTSYIERFIDYTKGLFPCASIELADEAKVAIRQFSLSGKTVTCFKSTPDTILCQGDIISSLPFILFNEKGEEVIIETPGMMISNTCDAQRKSFVTFAPIFEIDNFIDDFNIGNLKSNEINSLFFIPDSSFDKYIIDLTRLCSFPLSFINSAIQNRKIKKLFTLNSYGYYYFLMKLSVLFMRREDPTFQSTRG